MEALQVLAQSDQVQPLASMGFQHTLGEAEHLRINLIYEYSLRHFRRPIQLEEIAAVANISPNSFCRFFKSRTRKTYSRFLLELRVGHACKLLIENNLSIKQLCYESGFNNFTSFYKYFKLITGKSPLGYQRARAAGGCPTEGQILARPNRANC
jgi:transcriptional regulator GlxA family with amidase domain